MPLRKSKKKRIWRTVKPKKGVYIHVEVIGKKGKRRGRRTEAYHLRRTKARARRTGKPLIQRIRR